MITVKTAYLIKRQLDWAVAKCEGATNDWRSDGPFWWYHTPVIRVDGHDLQYQPSTDWAQGGPIIEQENIAIRKWAATGWEADKWNFKFAAVTNGPTPLIAAMRCYVESKLGKEIELPEELVKVAK